MTALAQVAHPDAEPVTADPAKSPPLQVSSQPDPTILPAWANARAQWEREFGAWQSAHDALEAKHASERRKLEDMKRGLLLRDSSLDLEERNWQLAQRTHLIELAKARSLDAS